MTLMNTVNPEPVNPAIPCREEASPRSPNRGRRAVVIVMGNDHPAPRVHAGVALVKRTR